MTPSPEPAPTELRDIAVLRRSGLFDVAWFDHRNADLVEAGVDPILHFHRHGWRERRWPNAYFDTAWYLAQNPDVAGSGLDPLLHYALHGEAEGRRPIAHFEPEWYRLRHALPDDASPLAHFLRHRFRGWVSPVPEFDPVFYLAADESIGRAGIDPFEHYLTTGAIEGRAPSKEFDVRFYRSRYLAALPDANPLLHYRRHRHEAGIVIHPAQEAAGLPALVRRNTQPGPLFETRVPLPPDAPRRAKLLAFYLPQFHPVAENDGWWGEGFTEWTNVARALPRFEGHYQPRIPRDLGHYRLDGPEVLARQVALAREAGLFGFVFYFYWFNGRRLLERPLETLLADPALEMPFCLMWANENWTRRWDGSEHEVLLSQDYRPEDEADLIATFCRHFADRRYIRLQGRPLLMIYRAGLIPGASETIARWRALFRTAGHDPVFVMAQSFDERDPRPYGMDAAVEFPPHKATVGLERLDPGLTLLDHAATMRVFAYDDVARAAGRDTPPYKLIRTALPGWDNDARRQGAGMALHGATPVAYQAWLTRLIDAAVAEPVFGERLVCINAWNEWAEGAYLEPDIHCGAAFLNATARAVSAPRLRSAPTRLLLVGHDAFAAGAQLLLLHLGQALRAEGVDVVFMLLGGGPLESRYHEVASTNVFASADSLARDAAALAGSGYRSALVNTSVCGQACAALAAQGIACTLLLHEMPRLLRERRLVETARLGVAAARHVVFAAEFVRDRIHDLIALPHDRVALIPQGLYRPVDPALRDARRAVLRLPEGATLAVGLGIGDLRKGFDLFLQAWRLAQLADPSIHFLWVGDLDPMIDAYLGPEIAAAIATGTFHHSPFRIDGTDDLAAADVHLLTSREDPFPSVVLEAMSAGVPTVAFEEAGGAPALLRELRAGTAVPPGDITAMVRHMRVLALQANEEDRARLARLARRRFGFADYARRLLSLAAPPHAVSAMVPTLDYARFLPLRLASIFAQTLAPAEIVVLDDGSCDGSETVVRRVAERAGRGVAWVPAGPTRGVFAQWRRAADAARSAFVWIAEADDLAEPNLLQRLADALEAVPEAPFAFCDSRAIDAEGGVLSADYKAYFRASGTDALEADAAIPAGRFLRECLGARNLVLNASAVLWRRDALRRALERADAERYRIAGDWRLYAEALAEGGAVAFVAEPLNTHRRHADAATRRLDPAAHLAEIRRMHRHMRHLLGPDAALRREQEDALAQAMGALKALHATAGRP